MFRFCRGLRRACRRPAFVWVFLVAALRPGPGRAESLLLDQAVSLAVAENPGLAEIKARAEALAAVPPQAGTLPDPALSVGLLNVPTHNFSVNQDEMTMLEIGVSQSVPFPGKLGLAEQAAMREALGAAKTAEEARLRLLRDVRLNWWQLYYYDRMLATLSDSRGFLQKLIDIADQRYRLGETEQQESLLARLELAKLRDRQLEWVAMRHAGSARLNILLNRPGNQSLQLPAESQARFPKLVTESELLARAEQQRPLLAQKQATVGAAEDRLELAKKEILPDFNVWVGYGVRNNHLPGVQSSDLASVRLSLNVPIYAATKQSKQVDQRHSELLQERFALQDAQRAVEAEVTAALVAYHHARERLHLYEEGLIPQARQTLDSLLASYRVGRVPFADLLKSQLALFDYQAQYWGALAQSQQALANLTAALGMEAL